MSLFGGKKKTYVSSVCYNLAGDEQLRPNYLKTMVAGNVIGSSGQSIADSIRRGMLTGPSIKLRSFYRWAEDNYNDVIDLEASGLSGAPDINKSIVEAHIGGSVSVQLIQTGPADYEAWAEQWMLNNYPAEFLSVWSTDYDDTTSQITVTRAGGAGSTTFTPANFNKNALYIYATYNEVSEGVPGSTVTDPLVTLAPGASFPSTAGWTTVSYTSVSHATPVPWTETHGVYEKTDPPVNNGSGTITEIYRVMYQDQIDPDTKTYQLSQRTDTLHSTSPLKVMIYRMGSGNLVLDAQVTSNSVGGFFPPVLVRLDNNFISSSYLPDQYDAAKKAYKRLTGGGNFDDLVTKLEDNESLGDIDYAYVVPGVSLNVRENSCKKYLYKFFQGAMATDLYGSAAYASWIAGVSASVEDMDTWVTWANSQGTGGPLDGAPAPPRASYGSGARNEIRLRMANAALGYDTRIAWKSIEEEIGSGLGKVGATPGEVWLEKGAASAEAGPGYSGLLGVINDLAAQTQDLRIYWQTDADTWRKLTIRGLVHQNFIYKGKYVEILAHEALDDIEESGFIVPIHYETWRSMSLKDTTQMSTACIFVVLNSYQIVKQKWYQTGFFKVLLFIAIVAIAVIFPPGGFLGGSTAAGFSLGFTYLAILQTALTVLVGMIVTAIITKVAIAAFGEKVGAIVAAVLSLVTLQVGSSLQSGLTIQQAFTNLMNPVSLMYLSNAVGQGVAGVIRVGIQETLAKTQDMLGEYANQSKTISQLYEENIGYGRGLIDPTMLQGTDQWYVESGDTFLARTLMTGSDIAELSVSLLSSFSDLTLSTDLPL